MPNEPFTPEQISQILEEFFKIVGTRQYVGARYVPIFGRKGEDSMEWDNTKPYEPLSVVLYLGNSYTSKQYVPEGVEITNEAYWANTGNYNAQVEQYRREVFAIMTALPSSEFDAEHTVKDAIDAISGIIPATDFDAENTVKDAIDAISAVIPTTDFDAENTVKDAIDAVAAIIPATDFDSETTVKDYVDSFAVANLTYEAGTVGDAIYYLLKFPRTHYKLEMKLAKNGVETETLLNCVLRDKPFYAFNTTNNQCFVFEGNKYNTEYAPPDRGGIYGMNADNDSFQLYQGNGTLSAFSLHDTFGYEYVFGGWQPLIIDGAVQQLSEYETFYAYMPYGFLGYDDDYIYTGEIFGRTLRHRGAFMSEVQQLFNTKGIPNIYCTDGGDSMRHFFGTAAPSMLSMRFNNNHNDRGLYYYMAINPKE